MRVAGKALIWQGKMWVIASLPIVGAVAGERGDRARDPVEQGPDPGAVVGLVAGQLHCFDPPRANIHPEVQLASHPACPAAMLLDQPLAGPAQLQPGAVHQ